MDVLQPHHISISVRDAEVSTEFYGGLGFEPAFEMVAPDVTIRHLATKDGLIIEIFAFPENRLGEALSLEPGNDMRQVGVKHMALVVDDLEVSREVLSRRYPGRVTNITHGRTGLDFFWVADPDGMWVEIVGSVRS